MIKTWKGEESHKKFNQIRRLIYNGPSVIVVAALFLITLFVLNLDLYLVHLL